MSKNTVRCFALIVLTMIAGTAIAAQLAESRTHYVVARRDRTPVWYATTIVTDGETSSSELYLLQDSSGRRVRIDVQRSHKDRRVTAEYKLDNGRPVIVKLELPGKATSRSQAAVEYKQRPELRNEDVLVTVESIGQVLRTGEKEWMSGEVPVRQKAKAIVGSGFTATMRDLSAILGFPQFGGACSTFPFVSDGGKCVLNTELMVATIRPDCDFDAKLGKPCSSDQKTRAKQQPKNGRVGSY